MSGHSKWNNIKNTKLKMDQTRGKIFTKIGREIAVAVKEGGSDPSINTKLYDVIAKARQNNMPNDNISRSIKKASGELSAVNFSEIVYEGYGAGGVAFVVLCLTDNRNRTVGDVRHAFDKLGGSLGINGSVMFLFNHRGVVVVEKGQNLEDDAMMLAIDAGADDFEVEDEVFVVTTPVSEFHAVQRAFEDAKYTFVSSGIEYVPINTVDVEPQIAEKIQRLVDHLSDLDDVQNVFHNANI